LPNYLLHYLQLQLRFMKVLMNLMKEIMIIIKWKMKKI